MYLTNISNGEVKSCNAGWSINDARHVVYADLFDDRNRLVISSTLEYIIEAAKERKYDITINVCDLEVIIAATTKAAKVKPLTAKEKRVFLEKERARLAKKYGEQWVQDCRPY